MSKQITITTPQTIWLMGLSGAGKTTISNALREELKKNDIPSIQLDGDVIRNIFPDTGFSKLQRMSHATRVAGLANELTKQGFVVICSIISPYNETQEMVKDVCSPSTLVYLDCPIEECENRDPKGLYKKVREGAIKGFTGIDAPFEIPTVHDLELKTKLHSVSECVDQIIRYIESDW